MLFLTVTFLFSCGSDDTTVIIDEEPVAEENPSEDNSSDEGENTEEEETNTTEQRQGFLDILTGETSLTWKIESAVLTNSNGTTDISDNVSIQDDEFIFESNGDPANDNVAGILTWRKRKGFDLIGGISDDNYYSPETIAFSIDSNIEIVTPEIQLKISEDGTVNGIISFENNEENTSISITLKEKSPSDYKTIPAALSFDFLYDFDFAFSYNKSTGFNGSYKTNSLYLSYRDNAQNRNVYKYDLEDQSLKSIQISFSESEFISSRLHFYDGKLVVFGSGHISETDLYLNQVLTTVTNGLNQNLSRPGTASVDSQIYAFGGELEALGAPLTPLNILKYNNDLQGLEQIYVADSPRRYTEGTIIDNSLYIVGGQYYITDSPVTYVPNILVYNLSNKSTEFINLNFDLGFTSVARYENLIFFAGQTPSIENNMVLYFGAYDTYTGNLSEIPITLENINNEDVSIVAMTILNNKLYLALQTSSGTITSQVVDLSEI